MRNLVSKLDHWFTMREYERSLKLEDLKDGDIIAMGDPMYSLVPQVYKLKTIDGKLSYEHNGDYYELDQSHINICHLEKLKWER